MLGHTIEVAQASEPTDIIWENLRYTRRHRIIRIIFVTIIIMIFIFLSFILFTYLKSTAGNNKLKYPSSLNCKAFAD